MTPEEVRALVVALVRQLGGDTVLGTDEIRARVGARSVELGA